MAGYVLVAKPGSSAPANEADGARVCTAIIAGSTTCSATGLTNGAMYTFGLFALDEALNRSQPAVVSAAPNGKVPDTKAPAAVTGLKAKVSGHTVTLTWKNPGADFDHVVVTSGGRKPASAKAATRVYSGSGTKATTKLASGQSRWFAVVAYDAAGNASAPASVHVSVASASPFGPAPHAKVHGKVHLSWPVVKGARYYNVQIYAGKKRVLVSWPGGRGLGAPQGQAQAWQDLHLVCLAGPRRKGQGALRQADRKEHLHVRRVSDPPLRTPGMGGVSGGLGGPGLPIRPSLAVRWQPSGRPPRR